MGRYIDDDTRAMFEDVDSWKNFYMFREGGGGVLVWAKVFNLKGNHIRYQVQEDTTVEIHGTITRVGSEGWVPIHLMEGRTYHFPYGEARFDGVGKVGEEYCLSFRLIHEHIRFTWRVMSMADLVKFELMVVKARQQIWEAE